MQLNLLRTKWKKRRKLKMLLNNFFQAVEDLQNRIRATQHENIQAAATMLSEALISGRQIFLYDTGHIIDAELFNRAGGLVAFRRFNMELLFAPNIRQSPINSKSMPNLAKLALDATGVTKGDVMIIGSVSGKTFNVIDLAIECQNRGVKIIAVTSIAYSSTLESMHPSGKRLFECGNVVIDNCAPAQDAMLTHESLPSAVIPASGLGAAYIMWAVVAQTLQNCVDNHVIPGILRSVNVEENRLYNQKLEREYIEKGI